MSEEEQNENLLDAGISGISKSLGGTTKIITVIIIVIVAVLLMKWFKKGRK